MVEFVKSKEIDGIDEYIISKPHPPEIPAFERAPLKFYVSLPAGGINAETIPLLAMPGHQILAGMTPYLRSLHRSISTKMNALVITVEFLGIKAIRSGVGTYAFDDWCWMQTNLNLKARDLPPVPKVLQASFEGLCDYLKTYPAAANTRDTPLALLVVKHEGDHYDFGLVQVIDCLWAIRILKNEYPQINWSALTAAGISHGGYMACQCAKLAPNTFGLALNAYGWTGPYLPWLLKEEWLRPVEFNGVHFVCVTENYWSSDPHHPFFLSPDRILIRSQNDMSQLNQWRAQQHDHRPHMVFTQQVDDQIHSASDKMELIAKMKEEGFVVEYLPSTSDLIAKYRTLGQTDHVSFRGLIYDFLTPDRLPQVRDIPSDFERKSLVSYRCGQSLYQVDFAQEFPVLKITPI